ncbi:MAG TPA: cytochrome c oxidase assembly protein [Gemmatimonadales bacterium]|jgi:cytochrome c oxidase assembly factor CtaG/cytochrome c2
MIASVLLHGGAPLAPHDLWSAWSWEPAVVAGLAVTALLYGRGMARLRARSRRRSGTRRLEALGFWSGWAILALALVSPLHRLGEALLSAHMAQHELIMALAAPLLVLGRPLVVTLWGLPPRWRRPLGGWVSGLRPIWRACTRIEVAWLLHAAAIVGWHVPGLYQRTLDSDLIHGLQHSSFLLTALVFWWSVLPGAVLRRRHGAAILSLFGTTVYTGGLGALLTLGHALWYPAYGAAAAPWGLTPLEDQQLAGLIMWVPGGLSYLAATAWLVIDWLRVSEVRAARLDRARTHAAAAALLLLLFLPACERPRALSAAEAERVVGGDPGRGALAFRRYGCGSCHSVEGSPGAVGLVGPPLGGIAARAYIAGVLTNTPEHLARWIQSPQDVDSLTAMPDLDVTAGEARDIAAWLYTRR